MREFQSIYIEEISQGPVQDVEQFPHQISRPKVTRPPRTVGRIHVEAEGGSQYQIGVSSKAEMTGLLFRCREAWTRGEAGAKTHLQSPLSFCHY